MRIDARLDPVSLDPLRFNSAESLRIYRMVYSSLYSWDDERTLQPVLAAAAPEVAADGMRYDIELREGVTFQDGSPFTADDVVFTYEAVMNPENTSTWKQALGNVESVEKTGEYGVRITMSAPYSPMTGILALIPISADEKPYVANDTYANTMNGTGPYLFENWEQGVAVEVVEDSTVQIIALLSLAADAPTADVNMRKTIAWAIDRDTIRNQVFAEPPSPRPPCPVRAYRTSTKSWAPTYQKGDAEAEARRYLAAAGGAPDRALKLVVRNTPELTQIATIMQSNLKDLGITVEVIARRQLPTCHVSPVATTIC